METLARSEGSGGEKLFDSAAFLKMQDKIEELPLLPQVLVRILQLDPNSNNYFEEFGKLTKEDPAFAVRIIALANSASSAPAVPIATIRDAMTRLGAQVIRSHVASLAVQRVFMPTKPNEVSLWQHSVYCAVAAAKTAELATKLKVDPAEAYLVGLLHDIGRFVMFQHAAPELLAVDESHWNTPAELIEADITIYKITHSELGYKACKHWRLPESICDVVQRHHTPVKGTIVPGSVDALVFCVQVADNICLSLLQRDDFDEISPEERERLILTRCVPSEQQADLLPVGALTINLDGIRAESRDLLEGLGFA